MSQELELVSEFKQCTHDYWTTHADYDSVNALLLHWVEDDLNVRPEVLKLQNLFEDDFHFNTRIYPIPSEHSEVKLGSELNKFIESCSLERRSLTILYYAGHADDADSSSPPGYSEWRA